MSFPFKIVIEDDWLVPPNHHHCLSDLNHHLCGICNDYEDEEWWLDKFMRFVWDSVSQTALTRRAETMLKNEEAYHSIQELSLNNLRKCLNSSNSGKGSEVAEIVLYGIMRRHFRAIAAVPKIFYKQNPNVPVHGADSVHIIVDERSGEFSVWYGEAKFYKSFESALSSLLDSVESSLEKRAITKENQILVNLRDLDYCVSDTNVRNNIVEFLSENTSMDEIKKILHVPMLLLCESSMVSEYKCFSDECRQKFESKFLAIANSYFETQKERLKSLCGYERINFHLVLFPVKSKEEIMERFFAELDK